MALTFTASGDYVNYGSGSSLDNLTTATYLAWILPTNDTASEFQSVIEKPTSGGTTRKQLAFTDTNTLDMVMRVVRGTTNLTARSDTAVVTVDTWNFVGTVYNTGGVDADQKLFVGSLTSAAAEVSAYGEQVVGSGTVSSDATGSMFVGGNGNNFAGRVAWVGIWDRVLSLGEIRDQQFRPRATSGCVLFSHIGFTGTGTQPDWSAQANNGTINGTPTVAAHVPLSSFWGYDEDSQDSVSAAAPGGQPTGGRTLLVPGMGSRISMPRFGAMIR